MAEPTPPSSRPRVGKAISVAIGVCALAAIGIFLYEEGAPGRKSAAEVASLLTGTEGARVTFYVLNPKGHPVADSFNSWAVIRKLSLTDVGEIRTLRDTLTSGSSYGTTNIRCFEPGMGFRLEKDVRILDLTICLDCRKLVANEGANERIWELSDTGCSRFRSLYEAHAR